MRKSRSDSVNEWYEKHRDILPFCFDYEEREALYLSLPRIWRWSRGFLERRFPWA